MKQFAQLVKNRWLLTIASALAVYALVGFLLIPSLVKHYVPGIAAEQLKRQTSVAEIRFNPFLFTFEVKDFSFKEADGEPILSLQRLFVDFELKSLVHWAWTFADLQLEGPSLNLVIDQKGKLNLAKIADTLPKSDEPPSPPSNEPLPRLLLEHMALVNGSVNSLTTPGLQQQQRRSAPSIWNSMQSQPYPKAMGITWSARNLWAAGHSNGEASCR